MQTKAGAQKMRQTMIKKYGSEQAWRDAMRENGRKGGKLGRTGGFFGNPERARAAGAKGGLAKKNRVIKDFYKGGNLKWTDDVKLAYETMKPNFLKRIKVK